MGQLSGAEAIPLWAMGLFTLALSFGSFAIGRAWARRRVARGVDEDHRAAGVIVGATLSLFAFLLAFTFGLAADRYEKRKALVLGEATAIGAAHANASLLPDPARSQLQRLLVDYVDARLSPDDDAGRGNAGSDRVRVALWTRTAEYARSSPHDSLDALLVASVNSVSDFHTARLHQGRLDRVPRSIWLALWIVTVLALGALGYETGLVDKRRTPVAFALILAFSTVTLLIADLDRPHEGLLRLSDQALRDVAATMRPTP